eukprot:jgi/Hompol1/3556/HPOL_006613-RA
MSRFFRRDDDDSDESESESASDEITDDSEIDDSESDDGETDDSESDDGETDEDDDAESDDDAADDGPAANEAPRSAFDRFRKGAAGSDDEESDSDDDVKKVVRSARDKRFDEMRAAVASLNNARKIDDWVMIQNEFDRLTRMVSKAMVTRSEDVPRFFVRTLIQLEDAVRDALANKEAVKKLNASVARALAAMKQKIKKATGQFESNIAAFREASLCIACRLWPNPVNEQESEDEAEELAQKALEAREDGKQEEQIDEDQQEEGEGFKVVGKSGKSVKPLDLTPEGIFNKLAEVLNARGKRSTDKLGQIDVLSQLHAASTTPYQQIRVLLALIPARFDYVPPTSGYMLPEMWN